MLEYSRLRKGSISLCHWIKKIRDLASTRRNSGFIAYSKISTLESEFEEVRIRMPDSPDT